MRISEALKLFDSPLSQEQCWSICYGACRMLINKRWEDHQRKERIKYVLNLDSLILTQRGEIEILQSEPNFEDIQKDSELVFAVGNLICRCLDHGLDEVEICEVRFQDDLAELIGGMVLQNSEFDEGIDADSLNESWESRKFYANQHRSFKTLSEVVRFCEARLLRRNIEKGRNHYVHVTKALYVEASELKAFLGHCLYNFEEDNKISLDNVEGPELAKRYVKSWAKLWLKVMNELRQKTMDKRDKLTPEDYQNAPFDLANLERSDDMQSESNFSQRSDSLPHDAEDRIFNFLRSRVSSQEELTAEIGLETQINNNKDGSQNIANDGYNATTEPKDEHNGIVPINHERKKIPVLEPLARKISDWENYSLDDTLEEDFLNGSCVTDDESETEQESFDNRKESDNFFLPDISLNSFSPRRHTLGSTLADRRKTKSAMNLNEISIDDENDELGKIGASLTEIFKIRQEITRSELQFIKNEDVLNSKKCFGCKKTKFSFFQRSRLCTVCNQKYCLKCTREKTMIPSDLVNAVPLNIDVTYTGNPSPLLSSSQHLCKSMFNLRDSADTNNSQQTRMRNSQSNLKLRMCIECDEFLRSIEQEKAKQKWTVQLELDI